MLLVRNALKRATRNILRPMIHYDKFLGDFEATMVQVATCALIVLANAKVGKAIILGQKIIIPG